MDNKASTVNTTLYLRGGGREDAVEHQELADKGIGQRQRNIGKGHNHQQDGQCRGFLGNAAQLRKPPRAKLPLNQFHHNPQPDDVDAVIEHLHQHTLKTAFCFAKIAAPSRRYAQWKNTQPAALHHPAEWQ
jgi:hypothetical protein